MTKSQTVDQRCAGDTFIVWCYLRDSDICASWCVTSFLIAFLSCRDCEACFNESHRSGPVTFMLSPRHKRARSLTQMPCWMCRNLFVRSLKRSEHYMLHCRARGRTLSEPLKILQRLEAAKWQNLSSVSTLFFAFKSAPLQSLLVSHRHTWSYYKRQQLN